MSVIQERTACYSDVRIQCFPTDFGGICRGAAVPVDSVIVIVIEVNIARAEELLHVVTVL